MSTPTDSADALKYLTALARDSQVSQPVDVDGLQCFLKPGANLPDSAEHLLAAPRRTRAVLSFYKIDSFIAYFNQFKDSGSIITGRFTEQAGRLDAIFDYHETSEGDINGARWCQHRAAFVAEPTPEWVRWLKQSGVTLTQLQFAEFLEDNAADIIVPESDPRAPNAAQMISVATTLEAKTDVNFASQVRLETGAVKLAYTEDVRVSAGRGEEGSIQVPDHFYISVAPFVSTDRYLVRVRLRIRLGQGKANFNYQLDRPHKIVEAVASDLCKKVISETETEVLLGSVESVNAGIPVK